MRCAWCGKYLGGISNWACPSELRNKYGELWMHDPKCISLFRMETEYSFVISNDEVVK